MLLGPELLIYWVLFAPADNAPMSAPTVRLPYSNARVVRVHVRNHADARTLQGLPIDVWNDRIRAGTVVGLIDEHDLPSLRASGLEFTSEAFDLASKVHTERERLSSRPRAVHGDGSFFLDFRDFDEIRAELDGLTTAQPERARAIDFGSSLEGRPMLGVEVTTTTDPEAPVVVVNAAQHAREWLSASSAMFVANALVHYEDNPKTSARVESLLSQVVFVIAPVVNPDGYVYSWEEERYWRKNRRGGFGVDTNRNFSVAWAGDGASDNPEANNYRGEAPFSEPETAALRDLLRGYPNLRVHLDLHCFGQLVLHPWGFSTDPAPSDALFSALSEEIADAMGAIEGESYEPIAAAELYPAAGNAIDWSYGELGAYAITIELRPAEAEPHDEGFSPSPDQIVPVGSEALASVFTLADFAIATSPGLPGDDGAASTTGHGNESSGSGEPDAATGDSLGTAGTGVAQSGTTSTPEATGSGDATTDTSGIATDADQTSREGGIDLPTALDDDGGCSCSAPPPPRRWGFAVAWLVLLLARRRTRRAIEPNTR